MILFLKYGIISKAVRCGSGSKRTAGSESTEASKVVFFYLRRCGVKRTGFQILEELKD